MAARVRSSGSIHGLRYVKRRGRHDIRIGDAAVVTIGARTLFEPGYSAYWLGEGQIGSDCYFGRLQSLLVGEKASLAIGDRVRVEDGVRIMVEGHLSIGSDSYIGKDCVIVAYDNVSIGSEVLLAERVSVHDENHGPPEARMNMRTSPVSVGSRCWLGAGVVVTAGSAVGADTTVGANGVVVGQLPPGSLAVGVPARTIEQRGSAATARLHPPSSDKR